MPKTNEPGFLEQHLEKAVLAASVVAMILALSFWVVSSPREISLRTGKYPPEQVDQKLLEQAERLEQMLAEKPASMPSVPSYLDDLKARIFNPYPSELVRDYVQLQSGRQPLEPASAGGPSREKLELARLTDATIAPESPIAKAAREVLAVQQVDRMAATPADAEPKEVVAAHVAAVFEHGKLLSNWRPLLEKAYVQPTLLVLAVEAERRELLPDGSWSDPVPVSKAAFPGLDLQAALPPLPSYDGTNMQEVQAALDLLARAQEDILEPPYPDIYWPDRRPGTWRIHKPRTRVSDLLGKAATQPGTTVVRTSRTTRILPRTVTGSTGTGRQGPAGPVNPYSHTGPTNPYGQTAPARRSRPMNPRAAELERQWQQRMAARMKKQQSTPEPRRTPLRPSPRPSTPKPAVKPASPTEVEIEQPTVVQVPDFSEQLAHEEGILELWFHDTSLSEGSTYSYRVRLVLLNPLFGWFAAAADEADAKKLKLPTPWSEWSDPITVSRPTEFFLVGQFAAWEQVYVDVFTLKWGQRIKERFSIRRGEPIGGVVKKELLGWSDELRLTEVDFTTGAIAVDFDFNKRLPARGPGFSNVTTEMLYLDAEGKLSVRTEAEDKASNRFQELIKQARQAAALAGAG